MLVVHTLETTHSQSRCQPTTAKKTRPETKAEETKATGPKTARPR
jgi:hypothetical protein